MPNDKTNWIRTPARPHKQPGADEASPEQAIRDLTSEMSAGRRDPIQWQMEGEEWIVTYTFDANEPFIDLSNDMRNIRPFDMSPETQTVHSVFDEIEKVALVRFVNTSPAHADILFFKGEPTDPSIGGFMAPDGFWRNIAVRDDLSTDTGLHTHEILHALGLSHPGATGTGGPTEMGDNPAYTRDSTVMSYNQGYSFVRGLGRYDVAALQHVYGGREPDCIDTIDAHDLLHGGGKIIYSGVPVTLDLRNREKSYGELYIDTDWHIKGNFRSDPGDSQSPNLHMRLVGDTRIQDVLVGRNMPVTIYAQGNALPNWLQGGGKSDRLRAHGGDDVLTGGKGADRFEFGYESGFGNVVTDLNPGEGDWVNLSPDILKVLLDERRDVSINGKNHDGTELVGKNEAGEEITTVFFPDIDPLTAMVALEHPDNRDDMKAARLSSTHPSGLPASVSRQNSRRTPGK